MNQRSRRLISFCAAEGFFWLLFAEISLVVVKNSWKLSEFTVCWLFFSAGFPKTSPKASKLELLFELGVFFVGTALLVNELLQKSTLFELFFFVWLGLLLLLFEKVADPGSFFSLFGYLKAAWLNPWLIFLVSFFVIKLTSSFSKGSCPWFFSLYWIFMSSSMGISPSCSTTFLFNLLFSSYFSSCYFFNLFASWFKGIAWRSSHLFKISNILSAEGR